MSFISSSEDDNSNKEIRYSIPETGDIQELSVDANEYLDDFIRDIQKKKINNLPPVPSRAPFCDVLLEYIKASGMSNVNRFEDPRGFVILVSQMN